ncbi:hypothetical protein QQ054_11270 [Oscillatoria amoena NRMC-F 0135]|nr:hypothetical protein [Oscillatoria amoena NRMC-F 0135]
MTDHRINLTLYNLTNFMEGDIDEMVMTLVQTHLEEKLASLS